MDAPQPTTDLDTPAIVDHRRVARAGIPQQHSRPEEEKAYALAVYAETGSTETASRESGIPRSTISSWIDRDPDIDAKLDALRRVVREKTAHRYAEIAYRAAEELLDRVNNGDYHVDKAGNTTRRPIPGRELAFISSIAADKHALLTASVVKQSGEDASLTRLADGLLKAIEAKTLRAKGTYAQDGTPASAQDLGDNGASA